MCGHTYDLVPLRLDAHDRAHQPLRSCEPVEPERISSAARSATITVGQFVCPRGSVGITDASTTRRPSTTAHPSTRVDHRVPRRCRARHVPTGWYSVCERARTWAQECPRPARRAAPGTMFLGDVAGERRTGQRSRGRAAHPRSRMPASRLGVGQIARIDQGRVVGVAQERSTHLAHAARLERTRDRHAVLAAAAPALRPRTAPARRSAPGRGAAGRAACATNAAASATFEHERPAAARRASGPGAAIDSAAVKSVTASRRVRRKNSVREVVAEGRGPTPGSAWARSTPSARAPRGADRRSRSRSVASRLHRRSGSPPAARGALLLAPVQPVRNSRCAPAVEEDSPAARAPVATVRLGRRSAGCRYSRRRRSSVGRCAVARPARAQRPSCRVLLRSALSGCPSASAAATKAWVSGLGSRSGSRRKAP